MTIDIVQIKMKVKLVNNVKNINDKTRRLHFIYLFK